MQPKARRKIATAWLSLDGCYAPKDRRAIYERTGERVRLPPVFTVQGRFSVASSRYLIRPFHALRDERTREVNILAPVRDGKTMVGDLWLPDCVMFDPGAFLGVFQEDGIAKFHCKTRTWPILRSVERIAAMLPGDKQSAGIQEILFAHMPVVIIGPAVSGLQSRGFRYIWCDESWQYPRGRLDEAKGRNGDFKKQGIDKSLFTSQGGFAQDLGDRQNADWFKQYSTGRVNEWHVRCQSCGAQQLPAWNGKRKDKTRCGIVWDTYRDERGLWQIEKAVASVRFECNACNAVMLDSAKLKAEWNRTGEYLVRNGEAFERPAPEFVAKESFHWPAVITYPWATLLEEYLEARNVSAAGDKSKTIVFYQKKIAEFHDPNKDEEFEAMPTIEVGFETPPEKPFEVDGILFTTRIGALDVQQSHFEGVIKAFSARGDEIVLWAGKHYTWQEANECRARFFVPHENFGSDCQHRRSEVIENCARLGHVKDGKWKCWLAYEGTDVRSFPYLVPSGRNKGQRVELPYSWPPQTGDPCQGLPHDDPRRKEFMGRACQVIRWSNYYIKDIVAARRDGKAKAIKCLMVPGDFNEDFNRQMFSERKEVVTRGTLNRSKFEWVRIGSRPNHKWDCSCMIAVRAIMLGCLGSQSETEKPADSPADSESETQTEETK